MEAKDVIDILETIKRKENLSHEKSKKLYTNPQPNLGVEALDAAIEALREKEERRIRRKKWEEEKAEILSSRHLVTTADEAEVCEQYCGDCPHRICGKKEPKLLTLDELRKREQKWIETRGNQWVWIEVLPNAYTRYQKYTGWLCVVKRFADDVCNFGTHLGGVGVSFCESKYGNMWLAYDREVKGDGDGQVNYL